MSTLMGVTNFQITVRFFGSVCIFHHRVWHRVLSLHMRALCMYSTLGHHPTPSLLLCQISFLSHCPLLSYPRRKIAYSLTQSLNHSVTQSLSAGNRSFRLEKATPWHILIPYDFHPCHTYYNSHAHGQTGIINQQYQVVNISVIADQNALLYTTVTINHHCHPCDVVTYVVNDIKSERQLCFKLVEI